MKRNTFIKNGLLASGALFGLTSFKTSGEAGLFEEAEINDFVQAAHNNYEETLKIIEAKPTLVNCASQITKGDFETAIGAACHMGRRDIADMLVEMGARLDIFNYTFLGFTGFVQDFLDQYPELIRSYGPHGFTLLHHAKVGEHKEFARWLQEQGLHQEMFSDLF